MTKKNEVAERPVNEKRFCKKCEYYYSEFFTCTICYGEQRAKERIIKLLEGEAKHRKQIAESIEMDEFMSEWDSEVFETESKFALELIALIKGEK